MKVVTIVGARPQFIKAATVSRAIAERNRAEGPHVEEILVHTGQHFDANMSQVFFDELSIPRPRYQLGIYGLQHGAMTGRMLEAIEQVLLSEKPDWCVVYGDTNSTLAGALAAAKMHLPLAHVEAGLRSFNIRMPEEINRIVADRVAQLLLCPTELAMRNLAAEGVHRNAVNVGDVMYDATLLYTKLAHERVSLDAWGLREKQYVLCTVHRAENTDEAARFREIWRALCGIAASLPVVFPIHPRTRRLHAAELHAPGVQIVDPLSYLEMTRLETSAAAILTDSGGVQKEAFFHKVPCITLRDETEWVETTELGWNVLAGAETDRILDEWARLESREPKEGIQPFGDGNAADKVVRELLRSR